MLWHFTVACLVAIFPVWPDNIYQQRQSVFVAYQDKTLAREVVKRRRILLLGRSINMNVLKIRQ